VEGDSGHLPGEGAGNGLAQIEFLQVLFEDEGEFLMLVDQGDLAEPLAQGAVPPLDTYLRLEGPHVELPLKKVAEAVVFFLVAGLLKEGAGEEPEGEGEGAEGPGGRVAREEDAEGRRKAGGAVQEALDEEGEGQGAEDKAGVLGEVSAELGESLALAGEMLGLLAS
jgi:hypothetical protein